MAETSRASIADKARIQTSRHCSVRRSLDNGSPVGKECHLVGLTPELQDEIVVPHGSSRLQARPQFGEIHRPVLLMDLYRVTPTQRDMRASFPSEVNEISLPARTASISGRCGDQFSSLIPPYIERQQSPS